MKASELMCDDIVLHHGNAYKVFGIMGKANGVDLFPVQLRNAEGLILAPLTCFATEIAPIPLTAEIFKKNGFEKALPKIEYYDMLVDGKQLVIEKSLERWHIRYGGCSNYVSNAHELQHVFHIYGLDALADNFLV